MTPMPEGGGGKRKQQNRGARRVGWLKNLGESCTSWGTWGGPEPRALVNIEVTREASQSESRLHKMLILGLLSTACGHVTPMMDGVGIS